MYFVCAFLHLVMMNPTEGSATPVRPSFSASVHKGNIEELFIYWRLIAQSTAQAHLGAFYKIKYYINWTQYKTCTCYKHKTYKHNPKVSLFGIYCSRKKWQIKLGDAGTNGRFGLAFQYQIKKYIEKNGQKQLQIKNTI